MHTFINFFIKLVRWLKANQLMAAALVKSLYSRFPFILLFTLRHLLGPFIVLVYLTHPSSYSLNLFISIPLSFPSRIVLLIWLLQWNRLTLWFIFYLSATMNLALINLHLNFGECPYPASVETHLHTHRGLKWWMEVRFRDKTSLSYFLS